MHGLHSSDRLLSAESSPSHDIQYRTREQSNERALTKVVKKALLVKEVRKETKRYEHSYHPQHDEGVRIFEPASAPFSNRHDFDKVLTFLEDFVSCQFAD
jgi:hypothetical protein